MKTKHKIIFGDSRAMTDLNDESVHLIITSPPYWQLKDYGHPDQIGFDDSYEDYINNLNLVWLESFRVLNKGCRLCINIGDQFARSVYYGRYKVIPIRTEIIKFCEMIGLDYMGAIIWQKVTTSNTTGGATIMGSYPYPRNGIIKIDYEFILIFKKLGDSPKPKYEQKLLSKLTNDEWNEYFNGHWNFSGERQNGHIAKFPEELPKRLIKMFSFQDDTILDPFLGSGTTSLAAKNLNRNSIGYEINSEYRSIIEEKLSNNELFKESAEIEFYFQSKPILNYSKLPYRFTDSVKFNKKIDPRKLNFGSKITGDEVVNNNLLFVSEVISPNKLVLNSGQEIKLLGVKPIKDKEQEAIKFLEKMTDRTKVFLKFDQIKFDKNNQLLAYIYLKNKTFVNAHIIKNHLAEVDNTIDFKYKAKFQKLAENH